MSVGIWKAVARQCLPASVTSITRDFLEQFTEQARESLRLLAQRFMDQEVTELAGPAHARGRSRGGVFRAGSDPGSVRIGGQRVAVRKQRLKQDQEEVPLRSYRELRKTDMLTDRVLAFMLRGVSTRDYDELLDELAGGLGLSKSAVSRLFVEGSKQALEKLQKREFRRQVWCAVLIDAIHFAKRSVIVAVGVDGLGRKWVLGLREGNTESATVCVDLLQDLIARGLPEDQPFLFVLDGGRGLRRAVKDVFGDRQPIQRCLIHKARNIEQYVPERAYAEFRRRWMKIRQLDRHSDAEQELKLLRDWLSTICPDAVASLNEAGDELLTAHRLGAGRILRRSLTNTNLIESMFGRVREITRRVKNWRSSPDQIQRWSALALLHAERRSQAIYGHYEAQAFVLRSQQKPLPAKEPAA